MRVQTGEKFEIFQDRNGIAWGQHWQQRLYGSLDTATFLIPIMTPSFFKSPACRAEFNHFLVRELRLNRNDLILAVYYVDCAILNDSAKRQTDPLAEVVAARQYSDWRELRFEPFTSPQVGKMVAKMAIQIVEALERSQPKQKVTAAPTMTATRGEIVHATRAMAQERVNAPEQSTGTHGPTQKTEPPTHIVDAVKRGDYSTLTDALQAAKAGDRILVRPGLYREGVIIEKPVEIIGDGDLGEVLFEATGKDAILFKASMGRIANLTVRQLGGGKWYCVDISQGRLDLDGCDITSQSLACVAIHGGADPRLRGNRIHDGKAGGVFVYEDGQGVLEDNEIFGNSFSGVEIKTGGNPTLRRNRIHDGKTAGVIVRENGQGILEDNEIFGNAFSGIEIKTGGNPTLRRNRISRNGFEAIWVGDGGCGVFEENDLRGNVNGAWEISPDCQDKVKRVRNQD